MCTLARLLILLLFFLPLVTRLHVKTSCFIRVLICFTSCGYNSQQTTVVDGTHVMPFLIGHVDHDH